MVVGGNGSCGRQEEALRVGARRRQRVDAHGDERCSTHRHVFSGPVASIILMGRCVQPLRAKAASAATCSTMGTRHWALGATYCRRTAGHDLIAPAATPLGLPLQPPPAASTGGAGCPLSVGAQWRGRQHRGSRVCTLPLPAASATRPRGVGGCHSTSPPVVGAGRVATASPGCCRPRSGAASPLTMSSATTTSRPSTCCPGSVDRGVLWVGAGACFLFHCSWCGGC